LPVEKPGLCVGRAVALSVVLPAPGTPDKPTP
jgi:hypothetical protein